MGAGRAGSDFAEMVELFGFSKVPITIGLTVMAACIGKKHVPVNIGQFCKALVSERPALTRTCYGSLSHLMTTVTLLNRHLYFLGH